MSYQQKLTDTIRSEFVNIISDIYKNTGSETLKFEEVISEFDNIWISKETPVNVSHSDSSVKPKKPRKKTVVSENERCIALKKDGGRCAAKAYTGGRNPKICTLHNNRGANFGTSESSVKPAENVKVKEFELPGEEDLFGEVDSEDEEIIF